jgi:hypothetical protein
MKQRRQRKMKRIKQHKGHVIALDKEGRYQIFTKEEYAYGEGMRYPEWDAGSVEEAVQWIEA